jgi:hypothetical protein
MYTVLVCGGPYQDDDKIFAELRHICDKQNLWKDPPFAPNKVNEARKLCIIPCENPEDEVDAAYTSRYFSTAYRAFLSECDEPDWGKYGFRATTIRNADLFQKEKIDLVLVFNTNANAKDIMRLAQKAKISVREIK